MDHGGGDGRRGRTACRSVAREVRWLERIFEGGALKETKRLTGLFSIIITPPRTVEAVRKNPLGIYVRTFNWSQDVTTSTGDGK